MFPHTSYGRAASSDLSTLYASRRAGSGLAVGHRFSRCCWLGLIDHRSQPGTQKQCSVRAGLLPPRRNKMRCLVSHQRECGVGCPLRLRHEVDLTFQVLAVPLLGWSAGAGRDCSHFLGATMMGVFPLLVLCVL